MPLTNTENENRPQRLQLFIGMGICSYCMHTVIGNPPHLQIFTIHVVLYAKRWIFNIKIEILT
jgi:hypothetical protein